MKYLMLFADGFEDVEAITPLDVLKRGGEDVICASLMKRLEVVSKCGNLIKTTKLIEDINPNDFDALIIPGGPGSFKIMPNLTIISDLIRLFVNSNKLVAAICAAPHLVGRLGYFKNRNYTVHPGFEDQIVGGNYLRECGVVCDGNFITAKSMYYSMEFGLKIYEHFHGNVEMLKLKNACQGEK